MCPCADNVRGLKPITEAKAAARLGRGALRIPVKPQAEAWVEDTQVRMLG